MTMHPDHDLLQAYLDRTLGVEESAALEQRLVRDAALADALALMARGGSDPVRVVGGDARGGAGDANSRRGTNNPRVRFPTSASFAIRLLLAGAIAAGLLAFAVYVSLPQRPAAAQAVARLEQVQGEVNVVRRDGTVKPAAEGDPIFPGKRSRPERMKAPRSFGCAIAAWCSRLRRTFASAMKPSRIRRWSMSRKEWSKPRFCATRKAGRW